MYNSKFKAFKATRKNDYLTSIRFIIVKGGEKENRERDRENSSPLSRVTL